MERQLIRFAFEYLLCFLLCSILFSLCSPSLPLCLFHSIPFAAQSRRLPRTSNPMIQQWAGLFKSILPLATHSLSNFTKTDLRIDSLLLGLGNADSSFGISDCATGSKVTPELVAQSIISLCHFWPLVPFPSLVGTCLHFAFLWLFPFYFGIF